MLMFPVDGCQSEGCTSPSQERRNCCEKRELMPLPAAKETHSDLLSDQCQVQGCNTIVEGRFPYCVIRELLHPSHVLGYLSLPMV